MNTKKVDVYITADGKVRVYERGEIPECGELPEGNPLYTTDNEDEWRDWYDENVGKYEDDSIRIMKSVCPVPTGYVEDLKRKAQEAFDRYRNRGKECGWGDLIIDTSWMSHTFRASAAWKEMPTLYTFDQTLKWSNASAMDFNKTDHLWVRDEYVRLVGMADAAHELGFDLVFTKDFEVKAMGVRDTWNAKYDY